MNVRKAATQWIMNLPSGTRFTYADLHKYLQTTYPAECAQIGIHRLGKYPQYEVRAKYAVWSAMKQNGGPLRHTGIETEHERM